MTLQEIEKLRKVYSKTKKLWMDNDELMKYPPPLSELTDILDSAVWDRHNAAVNAENIAHSKPKTVIVELPIDIVKLFANTAIFGEVDSVVRDSCRKALKELK